jgi:prevent-host-death family protein
MAQVDPTTKTIAASDFEPQVRQLIKEAGRGKFHLTVVEDGEPVAVIMPLESAQAWAAERRRFFDSIREMRVAANLSAEEADELAREAVEAVRSRAS